MLMMSQQGIQNINVGALANGITCTLHVQILPPYFRTLCDTGTSSKYHTVNPFLFRRTFSHFNEGSLAIHIILGLPSK